MSNIRWEIDEAIDGYRVSIFPKDFREPIHKENPVTKIQALSVILRSVKTELNSEFELLGRPDLKIS